MMFPFRTLLFRALKCNYPCDKSSANTHTKKDINMASILIGCIEKHDLIPGQISSSLLRLASLTQLSTSWCDSFAPGCTFSILPLFSPVNGSSSLTDEPRTQKEKTRGEKKPAGFIHKCKMFFLFRCFILCNSNNTISCPYNRAIQIRKTRETSKHLSLSMKWSRTGAQVIPSEQKGNKRNNIIAD